MLRVAEQKMVLEIESIKTRAATHTSKLPTSAVNRLRPCFTAIVLLCFFGSLFCFFFVCPDLFQDAISHLGQGTETYVYTFWQFELPLTQRIRKIIHVPCCPYDDFLHSQETVYYSTEVSVFGSYRMSVLGRAYACKIMHG